MLIYPAGESYQRGEDRCQVSIETSVANSNRACNDLGYISAILKNKYDIFLKDYQGENLSIEVLLEDVKNESPDVIFISTTNGSIFNDLETISKIKKIKPNTVFILKGALFFNPKKNLFEEADFSNVDYLIGGEVEFIIEKLLTAHFGDKSQLKNIEGISYKENGEWQINFVKEFCDDLDSLPFPDRYKMKNELYINPETNKPMALITTSKGCCFSCKYCLSPVISGKKVRFRSAESIFEEIKDCIVNHNITDFFFKADTFTVNKQNVLELCRLIKQANLQTKINWVANSRVDTLDEEMVKEMKSAGCSLIALGFESGSDKTLSETNKRTTVKQNLITAKLCKKYGIRIFGYFLIGFPWEDEKILEETKRHIFDIDADYIEISIVVPFEGTPIYEEFTKGNSVDIKVLGSDSYNHIYKNYSKISSEQLQKFRKQTLFKYYTRPKYIIKKLAKVKSFGVLLNYFKYGLRMIKNTLFR